MAELEAKLKNFECQRCNECCRQPGFVYLEAGEAERIADDLKLELYAFTDRFCEVEERRRLVLKKHADEACIFLRAEGCSIHAVKPRQCRDFPVKWRTPRSLEYCAGLKKLAVQP
jgi:Fe-S-cluster containining protein